MEGVDETNDEKKLETGRYKATEWREFDETNDEKKKLKT